MFGFKLALRFLRSRKQSGFISFITLISVTGIAIGVASLIITIAVLNGFEKEITAKAVSLSSHIQLTSFSTGGITDYIKVISELKNPEFGIKEIQPYVQKEAVIKFRDQTEGIITKGVRNEDSIFAGRRKILSGTSELNDTSVILGNKLARKLGIETGDKVFIIAVSGLPSADNTPDIKKFTVSAIYESGLKEYDDVLVYINMETAQKLFRTGSNITGMEIFLNDIDKINKTTSLIRQKIDYPDNNARSVYQLYKGLFTWIELQKEPIPVVLGLIVIVAAVNITGFLLMLVLEKTETIGILKTMGARNSDIVSLFFFQGMIISLTGIIAGNILGYGLCLIQLESELIKIPEIYYMTRVPLQMDFRSGALVTFSALLLSVIVVIIPSWLASRLNPVNCIRFK
ncbi:MAG: ABC transporter permease [Ignavibacteria bacterium]|nr:ABC transporter permease [Ignavibacteria bacterium]